MTRIGCLAIAIVLAVSIEQGEQRVRFRKEKMIRQNVVENKVKEYEVIFKLI